jgi:serine/threonine-protein kinase RsbW
VKELFGSDVVVSVPARADFVHVLRSVTASVAARLEFPYDAIDDLRLAVDEACAQLLAVASGGSALTLRMTPMEESLEMVATIDAGDVDWPPPEAEESLSWRLMSGLADEARFERGDHGPALRFSKRIPPGTEIMDEGSVPSS